jgi:hypothetical protein
MDRRNRPHALAEKYGIKPRYGVTMIVRKETEGIQRRKGYMFADSNT